MTVEKSVVKNDKIQKKVYIPVADIYESEDLYSLKMEIPGVSRENLDITIEDNELKISAKSSFETNEAEKIKYSDFSDMDYSRTFKVGNDIDRNHIDAKLENGVLTLLLHKHEKVKPRKITINQLN